LWADLWRGVEEHAIVLVGDELDRRQHAVAAHVADVLVAADRPSQLGAEVGAGVAGVPDEIHLVDQLEIGDAGRRAADTGRAGYDARRLR